jgi:hypothetical protein
MVQSPGALIASPYRRLPRILDPFTQAQFSGLLAVGYASVVSVGTFATPHRDVIGTMAVLDGEHYPICD